MKQFMSKVKDLSQRAAEIKAAMERVPPKVAEIREAVSATAGQLQQLKSQIEYSVADLKADNEEDLSAVLQEIAGGEAVLMEAGYALDGVDIEISPVQRLLVHLAKVDDVHASVLRKLASANQSRRTIHAILSSLLQAQQMAATVALPNLSYAEVIIGVGPVPSVRLCWRGEAAPEPVVAALAMAAPKAATVPPPVPVAAPAASSPQSAFGPGAFFEKKSETKPAVESAAAIPAPPSPTLQEVIASLPGAAVASKPQSVNQPPEVSAASDPLARFKKMPNLGKR